MINLLFLIGLGLAIAAMLAWGFRWLPHERWQILATLPIRPEGEGGWRGLNLTWYGLLSANAYAIAVAVFWILLRSAAIPVLPLLLSLLALLGLCVPAARLVAWAVEKKRHTLTVGGAVFVGLVAAPWVAAAVNLLPPAGRLPVLPFLAALSVAYSFGEGLGRLACISFGCCYGRQLQESPLWVQRLFARRHFVFRGATKKIAYASGLEGRQVVPVQALTAVLYALIGLLGTAAFLQGWYAPAFVGCTLISQGWRVYSETLRADWRGSGKLSAYQWMGLACIPYALLLLPLFGGGAAPVPDLRLGLAAVAQPLVLLLLQLLWFGIFLFTGRSEVTGAHIAFHVHHDRI
jgi:Prolipoprotein diacylglyceryl transferase